jgi:hypothetical protein
VIDAPLVVGDITDHDLVTATCREHGVTQVVHFAAYKSVGESMQATRQVLAQQRRGTVELIEACLAADVRDVVFSSSCSVYGTPPDVPVTETAPIAPESVYAETKAMSSGSCAGTARHLRPALRQPALLQRRRGQLRRRIGEDWTFSINLIPLAMKALLLGDRTGSGVRRRLRHARRHLHPRLHPRRRPRRRPRQVPRPPRRRRRHVGGQRRHRNRIIRVRGPSGLRSRCQTTGPARGCAASRR